MQTIIWESDINTVELMCYLSWGKSLMTESLSPEHAATVIGRYYWSKELSAILTTFLKEGRRNETTQSLALQTPRRPSHGLLHRHM